MALAKDHLVLQVRLTPGVAVSGRVLAGIDTGRRLRDSMPLSDVVRTASSEIEQYDRIELDLQVDPHMHGFNALGAAHMLAELLENATIFSEPETPVTVTTGVSGQYVIVRILDHEGYKVVAAVGTGPDLVSAAEALRPELVVADVRMPPNNLHDGIEAVRAIRIRDELLERS